MKQGRREITAQVFRSHAEQEAANAGYWKQLTPDERLALVWQLTEEQWRLKGDFPDEPRIQRTIVRVVRGSNAVGRAEAEPADRNESSPQRASRDGYGAGASLEYPLAHARGSVVGYFDFGFLKIAK